MYENYEVFYAIYLNDKLDLFDNQTYTIIDNRSLESDKSITNT